MLNLSTYAGLGMTPTELAARYREYAADCIAVAQTLTSAAERLSPVDMAQAWIALAIQAEKNESSLWCTRRPREAESLPMSRASGRRDGTLGV